MKQPITTLLAVFLALIIANTGFASADIELCQTECEYSAMNHAPPSHPPCCKNKKTVTPVMVMVDHGEYIPENCPHFGSSRDLSDPLTFTAAAAKASPQQPAACMTTIPVVLSDIQDSRFAGYLTRTGLSPPRANTIPAYHLNCALLI
jgi:hypothetical protein